MACVHVCFFISFLFVQEMSGHFLGKRRFSDGDEWFSINKTSLCPVLQKEVFCQDDFNFEVAVKDMNNSGNDTKNEQLRKAEEISKCEEALKHTLCSSTSPLCLKKLGDSSVARRECDKLYRKCPLLIASSNLNEYVTDCEAYLLRRFDAMSCKSFGADFKGVCTRPTRKVPVFYAPLYELKSQSLKKSYDFLEQFNAKYGSPLTSSCMESIKQLVCIPIYCSDNDSTTVVLRNKKKDCNMTLECIQVALDKSSSMANSFKRSLEDVKRFVRISCDMIDETVKVHRTGGGDDKKVDKENSRSFGKTLLAQVPLMLASLYLMLLW